MRNLKLADMPIFPSYRFVHPFMENKRVLDLGCGVGRYLELFGKRSVGIDLCDEAIKICRKKGLKAIKCDLNKKLPFKRGEFEAVLASHVLEHVDSPTGLLKEVYRVLKPDGIVVIGLPIEFSLARFLGDSYFGDHPDHLYSFSEKGIERLLERSGFKKEKVVLDVNLVGRFPILTPFLYLFQKLPTRFAFCFSNAFFIVAKKRC